LVTKVCFDDQDLILELKLLEEGIKISLIDGPGNAHFSKDKAQKVMNIKMSQDLSILLTEHCKNSIDGDFQMVWETHFAI
jgi:hypothetical protein